MTISSGTSPNIHPDPVPMLDLKAQHDSIKDELKNALLGVLDHGQFVLGVETSRFEKATCEYLKVPHSFGVSSGTDALLLALMSAGIGPGDEVLLPAFTFFATAGSVARTGATPIFCDIEPDTYNLDPADAEKRLSSRTRAIMPVHLFGQTAEMDALRQLAETHDLVVIEDAAQALGAAYKGVPAGGLGDMAAFSFYPTKNLGACGDAGLVTTIKDEFADKARILRVHGMEPRYYHHEIGGNFRIDGFQSALLSVKLRYLDQWDKCRAKAAATYESYLKELPGVCLSTNPAANSEARLILPGVRPHNQMIWHQYTIRIPGAGRRDKLLQYLRDKKIGCDIFYPLTLDQQPCFQYLGQGAGLDVAHAVAADCLSLPMHPFLQEPAISFVTDSISRFLSDND